MSKWKKPQGPGSTYGEKLKDPRWQKRRLQIFERDGFRCLACKREDNELHVHHRWYEQGGEPWDSPDDALVTLCKDCHDDEREGRSWAEAEILDALRRVFLAHQLVPISYGLRGIARVAHAEVLAYVLGSVLQNEGRMREIVGWYMSGMREPVE